MPSDYDNDLLREAVFNIKTGDLTAARHYLERALEVADDWDTRTEANFQMSQITDDPVEKRKYLEETLAISPTHAEARRALAILDGKLKPQDIVDPDHLPAQSSDERNAAVDRFACPKCGARMVFDGDGRTLICENCSRQDVLNPAAVQVEQDFIIAMANGQSQRKPVATNAFVCQGCGARALLPPQAISETCSYCGSVYVLAGATELVEPDSIIPMAFNQRDAALRLVQWVEKHKITPQGKIQAPRGLYLPVWTFDIMGNVPWHGVTYSSEMPGLGSGFGSAGPLSLSLGGSKYQNKQARSVSGNRDVYSDDVIVPATSKLGDLFVKMLKEYTYSGAAAYDPRYLAGWPAEIYETAMAQASLKARGQVADDVAHNLGSWLSGEYSSLSDLGYSTGNLAVVSFKLVLVPVWVTEYELENRQFRVLINGQNGAVHGETPSHGILGWLDGVLGN